MPVVMPYKIITYRGKKSSTMMSIMPKAPGIPLLDYIQDSSKIYGKNWSNSRNKSKVINDLRGIFYGFGLGLASTHKINLSKDKKYHAQIHGDAHFGNFFYDSKTKAFTIIDPDTLVKSLKDKGNNMKKTKRSVALELKKYGVLHFIQDTRKIVLKEKLTRKYFINFLKN